MNTVIKTHLVKIGNSRGVRIPRLFLDQVQLGEEIELEVQEAQIVIRPAWRPRQGWGEAFRVMAEQADDQLLNGEANSLTVWDDQEWEW